MEPVVRRSLCASSSSEPDVDASVHIAASCRWRCRVQCVAGVRRWLRPGSRQRAGSCFPAQAGEGCSLTLVAGLEIVWPAVSQLCPAGSGFAPRSQGVVTSPDVKQSLREVGQRSGRGRGVAVGSGPARTDRRPITRGRVGMAEVAGQCGGDAAAVWTIYELNAMDSAPHGVGVRERLVRYRSQQHRALPGPGTAQRSPDVRRMVISWRRAQGLPDRWPGPQAGTAWLAPHHRSGRVNPRREEITTW